MSILLNGRINFMKVILNPGQSKNVIVTIANGEKYLNSWKNYSSQNWIKYCEKNDLGLFVLHKDLLEKNDPYWKKATWQKMLIGDYLTNQGVEVNNICYLDTDFLINNYAPNVFNDYNSNTIGLVSQIKNLPYDDLEVKRRMAFLRHNYYDENYPLDSALFMDLDQIFTYHNLSVQDNYACAGFFLFNQTNHSKLMKSWFYKYDQKVHSITGGGDECHFNYEVQNWGKISWLNYKFQALWTYEMAWKYPFLYDHQNIEKNIIVKCIEASLFTNYFLHFAGSWGESEMWSYGKTVLEERSESFFSKYNDYQKQPLTGNAKGMIKPQNSY